MIAKKWAEFFKDELNEILLSGARPDSETLEQWREALLEAHQSLSLTLWRVDRYVIAKREGGRR